MNTLDPGSRCGIAYCWAFSQFWDVYTLRPQAVSEATTSSSLAAAMLVAKMLLMAYMLHPWYLSQSPCGSTTLPSTFEYFMSK